MQKPMLQEGQNLSQNFNSLIAEVRQAIPLSWVVWGCWIEIILYCNHPSFQIKEIEMNIEHNRETTCLLQVEKQLYMSWSIFFVDNYVGTTPYLKWNEGVLLILSAIKNNLRAYQLWQTTEGCLCALHCATVLRQKSLNLICNMAGMRISSARPLWQLFYLFHCH